MKHSPVVIQRVLLLFWSCGTYCIALVYFLCWTCEALTSHIDNRLTLCVGYDLCEVLVRVIQVAHAQLKGWHWSCTKARDVAPRTAIFVNLTHFATQHAHFALRVLTSHFWPMKHVLYMSKHSLISYTWWARQLHVCLVTSGQKVNNMSEKLFFLVLPMAVLLLASGVK